MTDLLFNEIDADHEVIRRLIKQLHRRNYMALIKLDDGSIVQVIDTEEITRDDILRDIDEATRILAELQQSLVDYDALAGDTVAEPPDAPVNASITPEVPATEPAPAPEAPAEPVTVAPEVTDITPPAEPAAPIQLQ